MTGYSGVMATTAALQAPDLFKPHPNLSDEVNRNIVQSEFEGGGVYLDELSFGPNYPLPAASVFGVRFRIGRLL